MPGDRAGDLAPPASPMAEDKSVLHHGTHIFSWGRGDLGQLGTERDQSEPQPVLVRAVEDKDIAHVAASAFNSAFITGVKDLLLPYYPASRRAHTATSNPNTCSAQALHSLNIACSATYSSLLSTAHIYILF